MAILQNNYKSKLKKNLSLLEKYREKYLGNKNTVISQIGIWTEFIP